MKNKVVVFGFILLCIGACADKRESIKAVATDITESVYASGKIKAAGQYNIYSTVSGILLNIAIEPGQSVKPGQLLFELDHTTSGLNTENARLAMDLVAENNRKGSEKIQEMELAVNLAREKYILDSSIYIRQKKLWEQSIGSQIEFEQRAFSFNNSKAAYLSAKSRLQQLKTQLNNDLQRAGVNYEVSKKMQNDFYIKSLSAGKIYDILKEKGELITPQIPIAIAGMADTFYIELEVDENDIEKIQIGQKLAVTMDSYKGKVYDAVVDEIYPIMNERSRTFTVNAHFINRPENLFPNLTAEANIIIQTKKHAITIPLNYLVEGKFVYTEKEKKSEVKIGLRDYKKVEIIQGLTKDQVIYLPKE